MPLTLTGCHDDERTLFICYCLRERLACSCIEILMKCVWKRRIWRRGWGRNTAWPHSFNKCFMHKTSLSFYLPLFFKMAIKSKTLSLSLSLSEADRVKHFLPEAHLCVPSMPCSQLVQDSVRWHHHGSHCTVRTHFIYVYSTFHLGLKKTIWNVHIPFFFCNLLSQEK